MSESIGVGLIVRNSQNTIKQCVDSFIGHVDQCSIVLAGESTDKTASIVRKLRDRYPKKITVSKFEWIDDFAAARNYSFSKLNTDWLFWLDADDILYQPEKLRTLITEITEDVGGIWLPYHYAVDEFGNVTTLYERERLLRAKYGWIWRGRLHETVAPLTACHYARSEDAIVLHTHKAGESRNDRNFRILNIMLQEDQTDKRVWLYLGHQNFAAQNWLKAAEWYLKFGGDNGAIPIERYQALCYGAKALREMFDYEQSIKMALMTIELFPEYKDGYLELAHTYLRSGNYDKAIFFAKLSDTKELMKEPPHIIFINPLEYTFNKYALLSEAYFKKNEPKTGLEYLKEAYKVRPVKDIEQNIRLVEQVIYDERVGESVKILAVHLLNNKELAKLPALLEATPVVFRENPEFEHLKQGIKHYSGQLKSEPEIVEGKDKSVIVNIGKVLEPVKFLEEIDAKYDKVTVICPKPEEKSTQTNAYSQGDLEGLVISKEGRHIINLRNEEKRLLCEYDKKIPRDMAIRIFVGQGLEYWSPKTIKEIGCGGSETSAAMLAREFARMDCQPIIYAMDNQVWDGVVYRHFSQYQPDSLLCHLFISSRVPEVFNANVPAKQRWLWAHDTHFGNRLTPTIAEQLDVIIVLSHWHAEHLKRCYPFLKDAEVIDLDDQDKTYDDMWTGGVFYPDGYCSKLPKIAIIGDAIDTERFREKVERKSHRFVWCSSPDRGLEQVLLLWPKLKEKIPDAELKIFYGWEYFNHSLYIPSQREMRERLRELIRQPGVEWRGRIGQGDLARELCQAGILLYPPPHDFRETYGITFIEAQAAGLVIFYRQNGALGETIGNRGIPLPLDYTQEQITDIVYRNLVDITTCDIIRGKAQEYGLQRTWAQQAEKVLRLYKELDK